jgi:hypothetical protein
MSITSDTEKSSKTFNCKHELFSTSRGFAITPCSDKLLLDVKLDPQTSKRPQKQYYENAIQIRLFELLQSRNTKRPLLMNCNLQDPHRVKNKHCSPRNSSWSQTFSDFACEQLIVFWNAKQSILETIFAPK